MIPKRIAQTIVADVLDARAQRMIYRSRHRGHAERKAPGREVGAAWLLSECGAVRKLMVAGEVSAETVGLLASYAVGHVDALVDLERLYPAIVDIGSRNYADIVRITLIGE